MFYLLLAYIVVAIHFCFAFFVIGGALLVRRRFWIIFFHIPAVVWGILIEFYGWICPLTPLENYFRQLAGAEGYSGGFLEHYLLPVLYPSNLTDGIQVALGVFVIVANVFLYGWIIFYWGRRGRLPPT